MKGVSCLGIDPSLSGTAIYKMIDFVPISKKLIKTKKNSTKKIIVKKKSTKFSLQEIKDRMERHYIIFNEVLNFIEKENPDYIGIEGYSFMGKNLSTQAEVTSIILLAISFFKKNKNRDVKVIFFTPQSLKKYVTGKGSGHKEIVLKEVYKRYDIDINDNNIADAFVIAKMTCDFAFVDINKKFRKNIEDYQKDIYKNMFVMKDLLSKRR